MGSDERWIPGIGAVRIPERLSCADIGHDWQFAYVSFGCMPGITHTTERCEYCGAMRTKPETEERA